MQDALNVVLTACAVPVAGILSGLLWKAWTWMGFKADAQNKANLETEVVAAIGYGVSQAPTVMHEHGMANVSDAILHAATEYFHERWPDRVKEIQAAAGPDAVSPVAATISARVPKIIIEMPSMAGLGGVASGSEGLGATTLAAPLAGAA